MNFTLPQMVAKDKKGQTDQPRQGTWFLDLPIGIQINIMMYVCQIKEFSRSAFHCTEINRFKRVRTTQYLREHVHPIKIPDDLNISTI